MSTLGQLPGQRLYILIISSPGDSQVVDLIDEFRQLNWSAVHVCTSDTVTHVASLVPCVVMLAPLTWNTSILVDTIRADPVCLIPVLVEPMALPDAPWTSLPIQMSASLSYTAKQIVDAIRDHYS